MDATNTAQQQTPMAEEEKQIDWMGILRKIKQHKKAYFISLPVAFVIAAIYAFSQPNFYNVEVKLAPELSTSSSSGSLSSIMRSFGVGGGSVSNGTDAIMPNLYPDLMNSKTFLVSLFDVNVKSKDGKIKTTYYDYLNNYQKAPWYSELIGGAIGGVVSAIASLFPSKAEEIESSINRTPNPAMLTKRQSLITDIISHKIVCDVDNKTYVITIDVTDQDPLICAQMADSTCARLQDFITEYRSKKARQQMKNIEVQYKKAKADYEAAKEKVAGFNDANWDIVEQDYLVQQQALQNDMNLKYQTFSAFNTQLISARAKYEESRPVYTVLDGATVPVRKAGPPRLRNILMFLFLVFVVQSAWYCRDDIKDMF